MASPLTIDETMAALKCSRTFVYKLLSESELHRVKIGRKTLIPAADVERLLTEGTSPNFAPGDAA